MPKAQLTELAGLSFIERYDNIVLLGSSAASVRSTKISCRLFVKGVTGWLELITGGSQLFLYLIRDEKRLIHMWFRHVSTSLGSLSVADMKILHYPVAFYYWLANLCPATAEAKF